MTKRFRICYKSSDGHKDIFYFGDTSQFMIGLDGTVYENYGRSNKPLWENVFDAEVILQQWTGLLDKNGREIYEGDILNSEHNKGVVVFDSAEDAAFEVVFLEDYIKGVRQGELMVCGENFFACKASIIGNVFETPLDNRPTKD